jgi:hypothetical protein
MEQENPIQDNNIIELNEENEEQKKQLKPTQTPTRHLRDIKKVNYSKFFSEDQDNSEEYVPEESSQKNESTKKRPRPKSVTKSTTNVNSTKKKKIENETNNNMEVEEENLDKKNKNITTGYGQIINIADTFAKYSNTSNDNNINNVNNINIPNSDLILIILEICLNSSQFGLEKDNSSRAFWEEVGKIEQLKPLTSKFKPETLRKYWRTFREAKKYRKIIAETRKNRNELDNNNLKLLSSIKIICEYVSSPSKRKIEYFLNKHIVKPANKSKKMNVNDLTASEKIEDVISTFKKCFPRKKEKEIVDALLQTSFDIENAFLVLRDKENLGFFCFTEKDDDIVKKNYEEKDDKNEEYQELINVKGLEDVIRRKEFLYNVKIDRSQYDKMYEENGNEKEENALEVVDNDDKKENKEEKKEDDKNKNEDAKKDDKEKENIIITEDKV